MLALVLAATIAGAGAPGPATSGSANEVAQAHGGSDKGGQLDDPNRVVCRREEVTGSHFERRVCMTRPAWERQTEEAQRMEQQLHEQAATNGGSTPP